jgi:hydroxypyruvate reductase
MQEADAKDLLIRMLQAAIAAADPAVMLHRHLPEKPAGRCIVVGAGKAAAAMARAVETAWPDVDIYGAVVTRYGHAVKTDRIKVMEAAHPVPDEAGRAAAAEILALAKAAGPDDLVLALISGGGSALMTLPAPPLTFEDKIEVNTLLLRSGLAIGDMNRIRRRLSLVKGGRLAEAAAPAKVVTLAISDVPGDDASAIASGPTVPDPSAGDDLSDLVAKLGPSLPDSARKLLLCPAVAEPAHVVDYRLIATPQASLEAAAEVARRAGLTPLLLGDALEGEARQLGTVMAGIARAAQRHATPVKPPAVLLSGGETTVTIGAGRKPGRGGRNTEFLLSFLVNLTECRGIYGIAADTDGIDGTEDAAGALVTPQMMKQAQVLNLASGRFLDGHDSYSFFAQLDALVHTGPTLTNVNDFRAIIVL